MSPCLEPPMIRVGFFFSKEPLVCGPQRTLYASFIESIVMYIGLRLMMLFEQKRRQLDELLFGATYHQGGRCWSKEPLVCGPQRTLYPSLVVTIVIYNSLLICLLMFRMHYKYLTMAQEYKQMILDEPRLEPPSIGMGLFSKEPLVCGPE